MRYKVNGRVVSEEEFRAGLDPQKVREMLDLRSPPMSNTDREFLEGRGGCYDQFDGSYMGEFYRREAKLAGQDTTGKVYLSSLAAYPGDPMAWVSGRGDVQRVCEARGWGCRGAVDVAVRAEEAQQVGLAEGIVNEEVAARMREIPEPLTEQQEQDIRENVVSDLKPHWAP